MLNPFGEGASDNMKGTTFPAAIVWSGLSVQQQFFEQWVDDNVSDFKGHPMQKEKKSGITNTSRRPAMIVWAVLVSIT